MTPKIAVLLLTHRWDRFVQLKFERLRHEIGDLADVVALLQKSDAAMAVLAGNPGVKDSIQLFDPVQLPQHLGFPFMNGQSVVPGSTHFPVLAYADANREYDLYFTIEFDVEFSGDWGRFVADVAAAEPDFAALHFRTRREVPNWHWWQHCRRAKGDPDWVGDRRRLIKSFNPAYCLSRRGIEQLQAAHGAGWRGHYEILLATILTLRGCRIVDLAELGFCIGREQNVRPGMAEADISTVRWRPDVTREEFLQRAGGNTLFHPVKDGWVLDGTRIVTLEPADIGE